MTSKSAPSQYVRDLGSRLFEPVPIDSLVAFRVYFGLMTALDCLEFLQGELIATTFIKPVMLFKYYGFEWVRPWPGMGMYVHFITVVVLGLCVSAGFLYRLTSVLLALGFTYIFLLEKAIYLNHMYLICLVTGILAVLPANHAFSIDARLNPRIFSSTVPLWCLWLIRLQIAIPYVYGGFAKFDRDWLSGDVMFMFLMDAQGYPVLGPVMSSEYAVLFFTWGGLLFDLFIVPLLLWKRTQFPAFLCMCGFHMMNATLFDIGIFPWLMIGASTIFLPPDWPRRFLQVPVNLSAIAGSPSRLRHQRYVFATLGLYLAFQLLFPFRQFLYPGDPSWTDEGQQFSWRMMIRAKLTRMEVLAVDPVSGQRGPMHPERFLNPRQVRNLSRSPDMMLQFSHFLAHEHRRLGGGDLQVYWITNCSLNGRPPQPLIDPKVNLAAQRRSLWPAKWIMPLTAPGVSEAIRKSPLGASWDGLDSRSRDQFNSPPQHSQQARFP